MADNTPVEGYDTPVDEDGDSILEPTPIDTDCQRAATRLASDATPHPVPHAEPDSPMTVRDALVNPATFVEGMRSIQMWTQAVECPYHIVSNIVRYYAERGEWRAAAEFVNGGERLTLVRCFDERTLELVRKRFVKYLPK